MAERDKRRVERLAASGNIDAKLILELLDTCQKLGTFEVLDDLSAALGINPDVGDVLNSVAEEILEKLLPVILKMTAAPMAKTFEPLSFQISIQQRLDAIIFAYWRWNKKWPETATVSTNWKNALSSANTYTYREQNGTEHPVQLSYASQDQEQIICSTPPQKRQ